MTRIVPSRLAYLGGSARGAESNRPKNPSRSVVSSQSGGVAEFVTVRRAVIVTVLGFAVAAYAAAYGCAKGDWR